MKKLFTILVFEFVFAAFLVGAFPVPKVLGLSFIAQVDVTPAPTDIPTEAPTALPTDTPLATPTDIPTSITPVEATAEPNIFLETPADTPLETSSPEAEIVTSDINLTETPEPTPTEIPAAALVSDQNQVVSSQSVTEAADEEKALSLTTTSENKTVLLIGFAQDKLNDIKNFLGANDYGSVSFASQRLDSQITAAIDNISKLTPQHKDKIQNQLNSLCTSVESSLRANEIAASEDTEADLEIIRGKCLGTHL